MNLVCSSFGLGESATVAWWRYLELISTANLIAWLIRTVMEQLRVRQRGVGVYDVRTLGFRFPRNARQSNEHKSDFQFGLIAHYFLSE